MKICIIGTGYVGLVTGVCFAKQGNRVICVDIDQKKIDLLNSGKSPIYELELEELLQKELNSGRIIFTTDIAKGIVDSEIIFICVGTPAKSKGEADLSAVFETAHKIAENLNGYKIIVNKSTVPVGTTEKVKEIITSKIPNDLKFDVASVPEFLREGSSVMDTLFPERIVIGASSSKAQEILQELHLCYNAPILLTDIPSAEMIKYAANAFLATKISFINGIAALCERTGADVKIVAKGIGMDSRIGEKFLQAGLGFGGACFPKDVKALLYLSEQTGERFGLLEEVLTLNFKQRNKIVEILAKRYNALKNINIGILGLTFKPNTDDLREAPSIDIINAIIKLGGNIRCHDPVAIEKAVEILPDKVLFCNEIEEAITETDVIILVTEWQQYREMDFETTKELMRGNLIIDGRNVLDREYLKEIGFDYIGIGRS